MPTFFSVFRLKALEIADKVKKVIEPVLESKGFELVDVEYRREPVGMVLRVFIDQPEGVDLKACSDASALIDSGLDEVDIVPDVYNLEVSSPGINRPLKKEADFERAVGKKVRITTKKPVDSSKNFSGVITKYEEGVIFLTLADKSPVSLKLENVHKARLNLDIKI